MKTPPNKKSKHWAIVLNAPKEKASRDEAQDFLMTVLQEHFKYNKIYPFIASIIHDRDTTLTGELKTIHAHIFIDTPEQPTKRALLDALSELTGVSEDLFTIEATNSDYLQVQYLTHKNDKLKTQYKPSEIITNNEKELQKRYDKQYQNQDPQEAILASRTLSELMNAKGLDFAKKYQSLFNQIKREQEEGLRELNYKELCDLVYYHFDIMVNYYFELINGVELITTKEQRDRLQLDTKRELIENEIDLIRTKDKRRFLDTIK